MERIARISGSIIFTLLISISAGQAQLAAATAPFRLISVKAREQGERSKKTSRSGLLAGQREIPIDYPFGRRISIKGG
jgi:hypothetical protein